MRKIFLDKLRVQARIGILEHELKAPQLLLISIEVHLSSAGLIPAADDVAHVFDYRHLHQTAVAEATACHVNMLETLAGRIATRLLQFTPVLWVRVRLDKPTIFTDCDSVAVEIAAPKT
jgi:7,8-dihydroneopterin aldolase/epimerase/oxygenase